MGCLLWGFHFSSRFYAFFSCQFNINQNWRSFYHSQIFAVIKSRVLTWFHIWRRTKECVCVCVNMDVISKKSIFITGLHLWIDGYENISDGKISRSKFFFFDVSGNVSNVQSFGMYFFILSILKKKCKNFIWFFFLFFVVFLWTIHMDASKYSSECFYVQ